MSMEPITQSVQKLQELVLPYVPDTVRQTVKNLGIEIVDIYLQKCDKCHYAGTVKE